MSFEKARIKLLDKNTGQVLKEVDPFTSADAVEYDETTSVEDRITELILYKDTNIVDVKNLQDKDISLASDISSIKAEDAAQNLNINSLQQSVVVINEDMAVINDYNIIQDNNLKVLQGSVYSKADADDRYYTKTQIDTNIYTKAQADSNYYTKTASDNKYYNKTQVDTTVSAINSNIATTNATTTTNLTNQIVKTGNNYAVTTGTLTAYNISISGVTAYNDGLTVVVVPHVECGDAPTLKVNGLAALKVKNLSGDFLAAGDWKAGVPYIVVRVGSYFFIRASNRLGDVDIITNPIPNPTPTLIASVPFSGGASIARIKNYAQIYIVHSNNLYLFDCMKKKETYLGSGYINKARPATVDTTLKEWNNYWIYGSRLFNKSNYSMVKDFYSATPTSTHKYTSDDNDHTASYYQDNYLLLDELANKLYLVKTVDINFKSTYSHNTSNNGAGADAIQYRLEIYQVNADLSTTYKCAIANDQTWGDTEVIAVKNNVIFVKLLVYPACSTNPNTSGATFYTSSIPTTVSRFTRYNLSGGEIGAKYGSSRAPNAQYSYTNSSSTDSTDYFSVETITSPFGDRFVKVTYRFRYSHSGRTDKETEKCEYKLYDMYSDKELYTYSYSSSDSGSHIDLADYDPVYYLNSQTGMCNNPNEFIGGSGIIGYPVGSTTYIATAAAGYSFGVMTSKYGVSIAGNQIINPTTLQAISTNEYYSLMWNSGFRGTPSTGVIGSKYYTLKQVVSGTITYLYYEQNYINSATSTYVNNRVISTYIPNTTYLAEQNYSKYVQSSAYNIYKL